MRMALARWMPALVIAAVTLASGGAQARQWPEIIQCVFGGPFDKCG